MLKRLIAVCCAVWLGFICLSDSPVINHCTNLAPADNYTLTPEDDVQSPPDQPAFAVPNQVEKPADSNTPAGFSNPVPPGSASPGSDANTAKPAPATVKPSRAETVKPAGGSMATEMLNLINAERSKNKLKPMVLDNRLSSGAYLKSKDMAINGYFSHTSPTYGDPFAMMERLGITYRAAGENIALNRSVAGAHTAFMNSAGHRENILSSAYGKVGLGFYLQGNNLYVTQWFTD